MKENIMKKHHNPAIGTASLKLTMLIAMLIDHLAVTFPNFLPHSVLIVCEAIGGMVFPIAAFLLVQGAVRTRNINRYLFRLCIFWIVSIAPYYLAKAALYHHYPGFSFWTLFNNVGWTLFISLIMIKILRSSIKNRWKTCVVILCVVLSLPADWGGVGVLIVLLFYISRELPVNSFIPFIVTMYILLQSIYQYYFLGFHLVESVQYLTDAVVRSLGPLSVSFLLRIHSAELHQAGKGLKWGAYIFYPVHLTLIWVLSKIAFGIPV